MHCKKRRTEMTNQEYNLTIMDIDWEDGNLYETPNGEKR